MGGLRGSQINPVGSADTSTYYLLFLTYYLRKMPRTSFQVRGVII